MVIFRTLTCKFDIDLVRLFCDVSALWRLLVGSGDEVAVSGGVALEKLAFASLQEAGLLVVVDAGVGPRNSVFDQSGLRFGLNYTNWLDRRSVGTSPFRVGEIFTPTFDSFGRHDKVKLRRFAGELLSLLHQLIPCQFLFGRVWVLGNLKRSRDVLPILIHGPELLDEDGLAVSRFVFWELSLCHEVRVVVHRAPADAVALTLMSAFQGCKSAVSWDLLECLQMLVFFLGAVAVILTWCFLVEGDASYFWS